MVNISYKEKMVERDSPFFPVGQQARKGAWGVTLVSLKNPNSCLGQRARILQGRVKREKIRKEDVGYEKSRDLCRT